MRSTYATDFLSNLDTFSFLTLIRQDTSALSHEAVLFVTDTEVGAGLTSTIHWYAPFLFLFRGLATTFLTYSDQTEIKMNIVIHCDFMPKRPRMAHNGLGLLEI